MSVPISCREVKCRDQGSLPKVLGLFRQDKADSSGCGWVAWLAADYRVIYATSKLRREMVRVDSGCPDLLGIICVDSRV